MKIVIVDYGSGNLRSVQRGFDRAGYPATISNRPLDIADASHLVVPGVGAFPDCMKQLQAFHLLKPITEAIKTGKPYLGICLGFQILFAEGEEFGCHPGLDIIPGKVVRFPEKGMKVPHMGWNQIQIEKQTPFLEGIPDGSYFYFVHSYYPLLDEKAWVATTTEHGILFPSSIARDHIFACQFHPEKSQQVGIKLLCNFAGMKG